MNAGIRPQVTVTAEVHRAQSSCCGAGLDPASRPGAIICGQCRQPCESVYGPPEAVTLYA